MVPPPPIPTVLTATVQSAPEPPLVRRGAVTTGARLRLGFNAPGVIASIKVKTGDVVRKGQLLARLEDGGASAALSAAQAAQERAVRNEKAASALVDVGSLAAVHRDDATTALQVASAHTSLAAESASQRRLFSPASGTVLQRLAEPGEAALPGMPILVIDDVHRLVVKVGVTEGELGRVTTGQRATLVRDGTEASIAGVVSSISPSPLEDGLYPIEVSVTDSTPSLRPGTLLTVKLDAPGKGPQIRVPFDALVHRDGKTWVFVVSGAPAEPTAHMRELTVDTSDGRDVRVRTGLNEGERIVREGAQFLEDGQAVRLLD